MGTPRLLSVVAEAITTNPNPSWTQFIALFLGSSVVGGVITASLGSLRAAAEVRRAGYAETSRVLISRVEFPYRIRRRTSDSAEVLADLSRIGSDIQERLAGQRTWIASESWAMAALLDEVCAEIDEQIRAAAEDAWRQPPIASADQMNLGDWGPGQSCARSLAKFRRATTFRFGLRRLIPTFLWRRRFTGSTRRSSRR